MKTSENLHKDDIQLALSKEYSADDSKMGTTFNVIDKFKTFIYLTSLVGIGLLFNSCLGGYIATEPSYVENTRPARPSNLHIWIEGDWIWSYQTHTYVHQNGYWEQPRQNRTYVNGYWQTSPKGKVWKSGHWQKNGRQTNNRRR